MVEFRPEWDRVHLLWSLCVGDRKAGDSMYMHTCVCGCFLPVSVCAFKCVLSTVTVQMGVKAAASFQNKKDSWVMTLRVGVRECVFFSYLCWHCWHYKFPERVKRKPPSSYKPTNDGNFDQSCLNLISTKLKTKNKSPKVQNNQRNAALIQDCLYSN